MRMLSMALWVSRCFGNMEETQRYEELQHMEEEKTKNKNMKKKERFPSVGYEYSYTLKNESNSPISLLVDNKTSIYELILEIGQTKHLQNKSWINLMGGREVLRMLNINNIKQCCLRDDMIRQWVNLEAYVQDLNESIALAGFTNLRVEMTLQATRNIVELGCHYKKRNFLVESCHEACYEEHGLFAHLLVVFKNAQ